MSYPTKPCLGREVEKGAIFRTNGIWFKRGEWTVGFFQEYLDENGKTKKRRLRTETITFDRFLYPNSPLGQTNGNAGLDACHTEDVLVEVLLGDRAELPRESEVSFEIPPPNWRELLREKHEAGIHREISQDEIPREAAE